MCTQLFETFCAGKSKEVNQMKIMEASNIPQHDTQSYALKT